MLLEKKKLLTVLKSFGVPSHMIERAMVGFTEFWRPISLVLEQKRILEQGLTEEQIVILLEILNKLDSDKDPAAFRIGEREARISTPLLNSLSGGFCHGIGRSGELAAPQPKAAGASIMQNLANACVLSLIKALGLTNIRASLLTPFGTGMSIGLALRGLLNYYKLSLKEKPYVIMTQVDHKSPRKGLEYVGAEVLILPGHVQGNFYAKEGVSCSHEELEELLLRYKGKVAAIISNTTFFAPRLPDDIKYIAKQAQKHEIIHIINNAYGIQVPSLLHLIRSAIDAGRVDAIVQSTDKNFLTPVGGGLILTPDKKQAEAISKAYAGRASAAPLVQTLVSLLSMGINGYKEHIEQQQKNRELLFKEMHKLAEELGERIIESNNPVSCAMTLTHLTDEELEKLGGYLYNLRVTGPRVLNPRKKSFGTCTQDPLPPYVVMNAAIGSHPTHIQKAVEALKRALQQLKKKDEDQREK